MSAARLPPQRLSLWALRATFDSAPSIPTLALPEVAL